MRRPYRVAQPPTQWVPEALSLSIDSWGMKLTTHLHPELRMSATTIPLDSMPSWCLQTQMYLYSYYCTMMCCVISLKISSLKMQNSHE